MTKTQHNKNQRGNALFLILIAVALFAALSYAITQSGRGGGTVDKETAIIAAGQVSQYPAALRTAATRMVITGTPVNGASGLSLDTTPAGTSNELFSTAGGAATLQAAPATAINSGGAWIFADATHATDGFYIKDIGTNTSVTGREVLAVLEDVTSSVCTQLLKGLGLDTTINTADVTIVWATPLGTYNVANANTLSDNTAGIDGEPFNCFLNGAKHNYIHALVEQ